MSAVLEHSDQEALLDELARLQVRCELLERACTTWAALARLEATHRHSTDRGVPLSPALARAKASAVLDLVEVERALGAPPQGAS